MTFEEAMQAAIDRDSSTWEEDARFVWNAAISSAAKAAAYEFAGTTIKPDQSDVLDAMKALIE